MDLKQALWLLDGKADLTPGVRERMADAIRASMERDERNGAAYRTLQDLAKSLRKDVGIYKGRWETVSARLKDAELKLRANPYGGDADFLNLFRK